VDARLQKSAREVIASTLRRMPVKLRSLAAQVPVHFEAYASEEVVKQGFEPDILGLYIGETVGHEADSDHPLPPQILLYLCSILDFCEGDLPAFREEVKLTYLHELGHFFGWDEEQVAAHGLE
jgi:predicted Zn-dependent protease with MMP-like domain